MSQFDTLLADLPAIFHDVTAGAPTRAMRRPYLDRDVVCATNMRIAVLIETRHLRPDVLATLRPRPSTVPDVDGLLRGWRGDGRTHRLPAWDDDWLPPTSSVRVGWTPLMRRWVAFLLCHQIRVVETGATPEHSARFDCGACQGLIRPWPDGGRRVWMPRYQR